eukprot:6469112-Amphidinium_carterae.3
MRESVVAAEDREQGVAEGAVELEPTDAAPSMKQSTDLQLHELRRTSANSMVVALRILANSAIRNRMTLMHLLARPAEEQHQKGVTMRKTAGGCVQYNIGMADFSWTSTVRDMLAILQQRTFLEKAGFEMIDAHDPADVEGIEDSALARTESHSC